ncbi:MAG: Uma2 family endonuclease [Chloroflexi bacterium]|nr:Uma2 family endonuclease [Chloroflexota bacterium]
MTTAKPKLRTGTRMSLDEFLALGETDERLELFDGVLYVMSTPTKDHQFLMGRIHLHFELYLDGFEDSPAEVYQDITTILSVELQRAVDPDLVVILSGRDNIGGRIHVEGVPDIVVEILSTDRNHDLVFKRRIYAEAGVREYWVFDPRNDTVLPLELRDGQYVERPTLTADDTLTTPLLPGLEIPLGSIFNHRRRPPRDE